MSFSINTNLYALQSYNALAKINSDASKAQMRLSTQKKVNSVADDTSGFNVGKKLEAQTLQQKAQLNNVASARNYLSTAETALQQINDKFNQIASKYNDSRDPLKDTKSIANDIRTIAGEIDSIMKNTNINGTNLLADANGSALTGTKIFDVGGSSFDADFAKDTFLNAGAIKTILHGGSDPGVSAYDGSTINTDDPISPGNQTSVITATFADGSSSTVSVPTGSVTKKWDLIDAIYFGSTGYNTSGWDGSGSFSPTGYWTISATGSSNITSLTTTSGYDITGALGITKQASAGTGGLMNASDSTVLNSASNITSVQNNVRSSLGRIGNLAQTLNSRSEFLTSAISNNTTTISNIFDADMAAEQLNATKGSIAGQVATAVLSQFNSAPQQLMTLFR